MSGSISNNYQHIIDLFRDILSQKETVNIPYVLGMWLEGILQQINWKQNLEILNENIGDILDKVEEIHKLDLSNILKVILDKFDKQQNLLEYINKNCSNIFTDKKEDKNVFYEYKDNFYQLRKQRNKYVGHQHNITDNKEQHNEIIEIKRSINSLIAFFNKYSTKFKDVDKIIQELDKIDTLIVHYLHNKDKLPQREYKKKQDKDTNNNTFQHKDFKYFTYENKQYELRKNNNRFKVFYNNIEVKSSKEICAFTLYSNYFNKLSEKDKKYVYTYVKIKREVNPPTYYFAKLLWNFIS